MLQASSGPGEMGKAVVINNPDPETKAKIDMGWRNNAFNQLVKLLPLILLTRPSKCLNHHNQRLCKIVLAGVNVLLQTYNVLL